MQNGSSEHSGPQSRICTLRDLEIGDEAVVVGYAQSHRSYRSKLLSMGLTRGTPLVIRNKAPLGDPVVVALRDFELTLRADEAAALELRQLATESSGRRRGQGRSGPGRGRRSRTGRRSGGGRT
jgi:ferrous iron transport protein A